MKTNTPKKIVCSVLISLLQFGCSAYVVEAASWQDHRRPQHESRDTRGHDDRQNHERQWQATRDLRGRELTHWRNQSEQIHLQSLRRYERETDVRWRHRQWMEEQRLQNQREEMRRRQWWENQRYEEATRRYSYESERDWHNRQWFEQQRHEDELRQIEIFVLSLLMITR